MSGERHQFNFAADFVGYASIKVVGVGGAGGNAINRMIAADLKGVEFIAINTDAQVLDANRAETRVQIGTTTTQGLGAGANPEVGRRAVEESRQELVNAIGHPNLVFITAGMGGGTGTGAAPIVAQIAKEAGALTVAIVTLPFNFEGKRRSERAEQGLAELKSSVDTLITIPNERLLEIVDRNTKLAEAFATADEVLHQATKGISDLITVPGLINCDFADVRTVMLEMGDALMGTGYGDGDDKAINAARQAISSPLLQNIHIAGAKGVLINVTGGEDMTLFDVNTATSLVYEEAGPDANIIFGAVIDPSMQGKMRVTVIATGFGTAPIARPTLIKPEPKPHVVAEKPAEVMSLFAEETKVVAEAPIVPIVADPEPELEIEPEPEPELEVASIEEEPELVEVAAAAYEEEPAIDSHQDDFGHGNGNGNGNGNGHRSRFRVPIFSEDDRTIPAYIRRLDGNR